MVNLKKKQINHFTTFISQILNLILFYIKVFLTKKELTQTGSKSVEEEVQLSSTNWGQFLKALSTNFGAWKTNFGEPKHQNWCLKYQFWSLIRQN